MIIQIDGKMFVIASWFAEKENITRESASIGRETEKAYLLHYPDGFEQWIPKSVLSDYVEPNTTLSNFK